MSATDDEPGDRDERVRVIEFWRAVEVFSPQPLPRPDTRLRVTDAGPGEPAPWEPNSRCALGIPPAAVHAPSPGCPVAMADCR